MIDDAQGGKSAGYNLMKYQSDNKLLRSKTKAYESSD